jgi:hypothetical protein
MIVYHGSYTVVTHPAVLKSSRGLDFGEGFYITSIVEQAMAMAGRKKKLHDKGIVNVYDFDEKSAGSFRYHRFAGATEAWLDFVIQCRQRMSIAAEYDIIEGEVANDAVFDIVQAYINNLMPKAELIDRLRYKAASHQICLNGDTVIEKMLRLTTWFEI